MFALLREGLMVRRAGNLIFVCGGNAQTDLRPQFKSFSEYNLTEFQIFQPEFAMENYFSDMGGRQLDLGEFETLIGDLSHAIVIFPEAPGSFAETGYFSNIEKLAEKVILVLDADRQRNDSFIMMGPARNYEKTSKYSPNIQINYSDPDFSLISDRINRIGTSKTRKLLDVEDLEDPYDLFCLVYKIFDILNISTCDDMLFVLQAITKGHPPRKRARDIASILVGAGYLRPIGEFGHYIANAKDSSFVEMRKGHAAKELELRLEISDILMNGEPEFAELLMERANAH